MFSFLIVEKTVALGIVLCTLILGLISIHHGDWSLGFLLLLGKAEEFIGHHSQASHDAQHIALHKH